MGAPVLYLSTVTTGLKSLHDEARRVLDAAGYIVLESLPDAVGSTKTQGELESTLQEKLKKCDGMVQVLGHLYGPEPRTVGGDETRTSLAHLEHCVAGELGVRCYSFVLSEDFPADEVAAEDPERQVLQFRFRGSVMARPQGWELVADAPRLWQRMRLITYRLEEMRAGASPEAPSFPPSPEKAAPGAASPGEPPMPPGTKSEPPSSHEPSSARKADTGFTTISLRPVEPTAAKAAPSTPPPLKPRREALTEDSKIAQPGKSPALLVAATVVLVLAISGAALWYITIYQKDRIPVAAPLASAQDPTSPPSLAPPAPSPKPSPMPQPEPPAEEIENEDEHAELASKLRGEVSSVPPVNLKLPPSGSKDSASATSPPEEPASAAAASLADSGKPSAQTDAQPPRMNLIGAKPRLKQTARRGMTIEQTAVEVTSLVPHMGDPFADLDPEQRAYEAVRWVALEQGIPAADLRENLLAYVKKVESSFSSSNLALTRSAFLRGDYESAVKRSQEGDARTSRDARMLRASALKLLGRYEEAFKAYGQAMTMVVMEEQTAAWCESVYLAARLRAEAAGEVGVKALQDVLNIQEKDLGPDAPRLATTLRVLASLRSSYGISREEVEPMLRRAISIHEKALGADHPEVALGWRELGSGLQLAGRMEEAREAYEKALGIHERCFGPDDVNVAADMHTLAKLYREQEELDKADQFSRRALEMVETAHGEQHPRIAPFLHTLAEVLRDKRQNHEAEKILRRELALHRGNGKKGENRLPAVCHALGKLLHDAGREEEAEPLLREAVELEEDSPIQFTPARARYLNDLAALLTATGHKAEAAAFSARAATIEKTLDEVGKTMPQEGKKAAPRSPASNTDSTPRPGKSRAPQKSSPPAPASGSPSTEKYSPELLARVDSLLIPPPKPMELPPETSGTAPGRGEAPSLLVHFISSLIATFQPDEPMHENERFLDATKNVGVVHDFNQRALWLMLQDYVRQAPLDRKTAAITRAQALVVARDYIGAVKAAETVLNAKASTVKEKHQAHQVKAVAFRLTGDTPAAAQAYTDMVDSADRIQSTDPVAWCGAALPLALFNSDKGYYAEALELYEEIHALQKKVLGPSHPQSALTCRLMAHALRRTAEMQGKDELLDEAEKLSRFAIEQHKKSLGSGDIEVARGMTELAFVLMHKRQISAETEGLLRGALRIQRVRLGDRHPALATNLWLLANVMARTARFDEALPLYQDALSIRETSVGADHLSLLKILQDFASFREHQGEYAEALTLTRRSMRIREGLLGAEHARVISDFATIGKLQLMAKQYAEAEDTLRKALARQRKVHGEVHKSIASTLNNLAQVMKKTDRPTEAEALYRESIATAKKATDGDAAIALCNLGNLLFDGRRDKEALACLREAVEFERKRAIPDKRDLAIYLRTLGWTLIAGDRGDHSGAAEAATVMKEAIALEETVYGKQSSKVAATRALLGMALRDCGRVEEAEQEMRHALAGLVAHGRKAGVEHPDLKDSLTTYQFILKALKLPPDAIAERLRRVEAGEDVGDVR